MAGLAAALGFPYNSQFLLSGHSCCDSGGTTQLHPPHSPQTSHVCSCQLDQVLQQKMSTLPLGLLPRPAGYTGQPNIMFAPTGREPSVYPQLVRQCDIKDMTSGAMNPAWFTSSPRFADHHNQFDRSSYLAYHRFADRFSPVDLNSGARRKNATKETTSTLKAWLYEHRKNPYPTKGEKIMLAILTKMTLTQVSTWFANARRRLKKENKMTWSPRNRCGERKDSEGYSDEEDDNDEEMEEKVDVLLKEPDKIISRKTTVIRSPEDMASFNTETATHLPETSNIDRENREVLISDRRTDPGMIWSARSMIDTDQQSRTTQHYSSLEDSPVKSLRKWVDGCFDRTYTTAQSPDTPPQTPPCSDTDRLTEKAVQSTKQLSISNNTSPRSSPNKDLVKNTEKRSTDGDGTTNREIDAALALTTLFSRS